MSRLITLTMGLMLLLFALIAGVRGLSTLLEPTSIATEVLALDSCTQPCWHGIYPGKTTLRDAYMSLMADRPFIDNVNLGERRRDALSTDTVLCWSIAVSPGWRGCAGLDPLRNGPVTVVELSPPSNAFTLGDALRLFDKPLAVDVCYRYALVYFPHNIEVVVPAQQFRYFDPRQTVILVRFTYPSDEPPYRFDAPAWRGFATWQDGSSC